MYVHHITHMCAYVYIYVCNYMYTQYIYIHIYIFRERDIYIYIYTYIYERDSFRVYLTPLWPSFLIICIILIVSEFK